MRPGVYLIVLLLIIVFLPFNSILAFQNEPDGFRDVKWGTNAKDVVGLKYMSVYDDNERGLKTYISTADKLFIENVPLKQIHYVTTMEKDDIISVGSDFDCADYNSVKKILTNLYGNGTVDKQHITITWKGNKTIIELQNFKPKMNLCFLNYKSAKDANKFNPKQKTKSSGKSSRRSDSEIQERLDIDPTAQGLWRVWAKSDGNGRNMQEVGGVALARVYATKVKLISGEVMEVEKVLIVNDSKGNPGNLIKFTHGTIWGITKDPGQPYMRLEVLNADFKPTAIFLVTAE